MPIVTVYPSGTTAGTPATTHHTPDTKRGLVNGWSKESARRHAAFLRSVDHEALQGVTYSFTLTVRDTPETAQEWSALRNAWLTRLRTRVPLEPSPTPSPVSESSSSEPATEDQRPRLLAHHWVTEWQRRGTPHTHGALVWSKELTPGQRAWVIRSWLEIARAYRPAWIGQDLSPTLSAAAWGKYVAKHSARSAGHYQRARMPAGWKNSGRLWGRSQTGWPTRSEKYSIDSAGGHQFRRMVKAWRLADARKEKDPRTRARRISSARRMLKAPEGWVGRVRGVSEWVPESVTVEMIRWLSWNGYDVQYVDDTTGGGVEDEAAAVEEGAA